MPAKRAPSPSSAWTLSPSGTMPGMSGDADAPREIWERQEGEGGRAYAAFCAYRDLGPTRTMNRAYTVHIRERVEAGEISAQRGARLRPEASGRWQAWSTAWSWGKRAQAYDAHLERKRRHAREEEHLDQLRAHLDRQRQVAIALSGTALRMLQLVQEELRSQPDRDMAPGRHTLSPQRLPAYARSAGMLARIALEAEGDALGLVEIMSALDGSKTGT